MDELESRVEKYIKLERKALEKVRISASSGSYLEGSAKDFLSMARDYFSDALHFREKGDLLNCFAALNYSYGWIDAGVRLGILDGAGDNRMFTLHE